MGGSRPSGTDCRGNRRWTFAGCVFDEAGWTLTVRGRRVPIETKPLEMLRELLLHAGKTVSKDQLLDRVWPDVTVVEASLPTAMRKLRLALGEDQRKRALIETVPGIGYRFAAPVEVADASLTAGPAPRRSAALRATSAVFTPGCPPQARPRMGARLLLIAGGLATGLAALAAAIAPRPDQAASSMANPYSQQQASDAIRELDIDMVKQMIAAGWNPGKSWDKEGNDALSVLLNRCEWDPGHDRRKMLLMARTLIEGGAPIDRRNVWGDTAYSIAKADRYCGPDHPVTQMLEAMCYGGTMGPRDLCLATYELTPEQRRTQGLPPKT